MQARPAVSTLILVSAALIMAALAMAPPLAAFFFPLEIEVREATMWLFVLAMSAGIDIYDSTRVAFVQMFFGPFDPLFKFGIHQLFPALPGWQVCRLPALLLPLVMMAAPIFFAPRLSLRSAALSGVLGAVCFLMMLACLPGSMMLTARPDATMHLMLALCMVTMLAATRTRNQALASLAAGLSGAFAAMAYNSEWRSAPMLLFVLLAWWGLARPERRLAGMGFALAGFATSFALIIGLSVHFDVQTYWMRFYAFYAPSTSVVPWRRLFGMMSALSVLPIIPLGCMAFLFWLRRRQDHCKLIDLLLAGFLFAGVATTLGYIHNAEAGGVYYYNPIFLGVWLVGILLLAGHFSRRDSEAWLLRGQVLGTLVMLVSCLYWSATDRGIVADTLSMLQDQGYALRVTAQLRDAARHYHVVSEDVHLFKERYSGERIDQGDTVHGIMTGNIFGPEFNATARRYFDSLAAHPPAMIVKGFTESPELDEVLSQGYVCVYCGNHNLLLNNRGRGIEVFVRESLSPALAPHFALPPIDNGIHYQWLKNS